MTILFGSNLYAFDIIDISAFSGLSLKDGILVFSASIAFCLVEVGLTFKEYILKNYFWGYANFFHVRAVWL